MNALYYTFPVIFSLVVLLALIYVTAVLAHRSMRSEPRYETQPTFDRVSVNPKSKLPASIPIPINESSGISASSRKRACHEEVFDFEDIWNITPGLEDPETYTEWTKVWIMGRFKVGKSTLLNSLGLRQAKSSNLDNTIGEVFLRDEENGVMYVDTEGFEQTINVDDPELRMTLIINHARRCADIIIIVVPMMTISDQKLILKSITSLRGTPSCRLLIVHNLMHLESEEKILSYKGRLEIFFDLMKEQIGLSTIRQKRHTITNYSGQVGVFHYYLGKNKKTQKWNETTIDELKQIIRVTPKRTEKLQESLKASLLSTYFWGYNIVGKLNIDDRSPNQYLVKGKMAGRREIKLGGTILVGCGLDYSWQKVEREVDDKGRSCYFQNLLINTVRLDYDSLELAFEDQTTIKIHYTSLKVTDDGTTAELPDQVETILSTHPLLAAPEIATRINNEKIEKDTREVLFKIRLTASRELDTHFSARYDEKEEALEREKASAGGSVITPSPH